MPATDANPATGTPATAPALPSTCNVLNWCVFWPGFWKEELYSVARCQRLPANYRRLANRMPRAKLGAEIPDGSRPAGKLGHDPEQLIAERLKLSLGLPSVGDVTRCAEVPGYPGHIEIDVRNVPTRVVGGEISAGRYNGGSVELKPETRDPDDAAQMIEGPILTGVAFLGEEPPALQDCHPDLQSRTRPRATFDDGSAVPANPEPPPELMAAAADVMQHVARKFSGRYDPARRTVRIRGREYAAEVVCFSDFQPDAEPTMTPEEMQAKLQAAGVPLSPEQQAALGGAAAAPVAMTAPPPAAPGAGAPGEAPKVPFAAQCRKFADAAKTPEEKAMYSAFADEAEQKDKKFSEMEKRYSELAADRDTAAKKTEAAMAAQFNDYCKPKFAALLRKVPPVEIESVIRPRIANVGATTSFAAEADRYKTVDAVFAPYLALPDDPSLVGATKPVAGAAVPLSDTEMALVRPGSPLDRERPRLAAKLRGETVGAK